MTNIPVMKIKSNFHLCQTVEKTKSTALFTNWEKWFQQVEKLADLLKKHAQSSLYASCR